MLLLMSIAAILAPLAVLSYTLLLTAQKTPVTEDGKKGDRQKEASKKEETENKKDGDGNFNELYSVFKC